METGELLQVHETWLSANVKSGSSLSVKRYIDVQAYDGISVPVAKVVTLTSRVPPTATPASLLRTVKV